MSDLRDKGGVIVGWISGSTTSAGFTASMAGLTAVSPQLGVKLLGAIPKKSGPRIAAARNSLVEHFLQTDAEWLFMVDADMTFESDALALLLDTADVEERPMVGGFAYAAGRDGYFSTIWTVNDQNLPVRVDDYPPDELIRVVGTGAACLLVHRRVFEKVAETYGDTPWPWFQETSLNGHTVGEDFTFCARVGEAGIPIHVHTGIEFGHEKTVTLDRKFVEAWRRANRVVVTGTGRCGTGFVSTVMSQAAIPSTHEGVWGAEVSPWEWQRIEASWLAAPHLAGFDGHVVHLVRHPLAVINSLVGIEFFTHPDHVEYVEQARSHVNMDGLEPVEAAMKFYVAWNRMIEPHADQFIRIEDISTVDLANIAQAAGGRHTRADMVAPLKSVPANWNSRPRAGLSWSDLPAGQLKDDLEQLAKEYGYEL